MGPPLFSSSDVDCPPDDGRIVLSQAAPGARGGPDCLWPRSASGVHYPDGLPSLALRTEIRGQTRTNCVTWSCFRLISIVSPVTVPA